MIFYSRTANKLDARGNATTVEVDLFIYVLMWKNKRRKQTVELWRESNACRLRNYYYKSLVELEFEFAFTLALIRDSNELALSP